MNRIENMQCEYMENPELICTDHPRFSWAVVSDGRDIRVRRRKITVRDRETGAVVWQDEKEDVETVHIRYEGEKLRENAAYEWQAASSLSDGTEVESGRAYFETGIRDQEYLERDMDHEEGQGGSEELSCFPENLFSSGETGTGEALHQRAGPFYVYGERDPEG
jgi:hypothetical protein